MRLASPIVLLIALPLAAQEPDGDRFARTHSRAPHAHHITLYDSAEQPIDPTDPLARPYSPAKTCGRCHDVEKIAHGWHFTALDSAPAAASRTRASEPWIYVDPRIGTALPLASRSGGAGFDPAGLGFDPHRLATLFGRHLPGGIGASAEPAATESKAWEKSGAFDIDCMSCHDANNSWSSTRWIEQIERGNFAWAPSAALGLAAIDGVASKLDDNVDPFAAGGIKTSYDPRHFSPQKEVFFDLVRTPRAEACYRCHTVRDASPQASPRWLSDGDVHLRAGMSCTDCHGHGLDHGMVRGYEGEVHPAGAVAASFSCRGCHLEAEDLPPGTASDRPRAGRFGAPRPSHAGLPPLHLEKLTCTACHSGPLPTPQVGAQQTSLAHALGKDLHEYGAQLEPQIVAPVFARNSAGVIEAQRWTWPAYFGFIAGDLVTPIDPQSSASKLRRALRVRQDFRTELADPKLFEEKVAQALRELEKEPPTANGRAVYVANGWLHRLNSDGSALERVTHPAAEALGWPLAHDVRPARHALGARGCVECHASDAPFFHAVIDARGPIAAAPVRQTTPAAIQGQDPKLLSAWERSFATRDEFKWAALISCGLVAFLLLTHLLLDLSGRRRRDQGVSP